MGILGEILSLPPKAASEVLDSVGEVTDTRNVTDIVSVPLGVVSDLISEIDGEE